MNTNTRLVEQFEFLRRHYRSVGDVGRTLTYTKVVSALKSYNGKITSEKVNGLLQRGLGPKTLEKISEFLKTGVIAEVEKIRKEVIYEEKKFGIISELSTVWGIGPVKAKKLYEEKVRGIADLQRKTDLLTTQQKIGLKYHDDFQKRIPRVIITSFYVGMRVYLDRKYGKDAYRAVIAGSYRRGATDSGDVDCIISSSVFGLSDVVDILRKNNIVSDVLGAKNQKALLVAHLPDSHYFRLDIEFVPYTEFGSALLYFTGSKQFNMFIRSEAKRKGLLLNEHGLYEAKSRKKVLKNPSETDIFEAVGVNYIKPENR